MSSERTRGAQRLLFVLLALTAVTLFAFWPVGSHDFVEIDDDLYVTENIQVRRGLTIEGVTWAFTTTHAANWHPVTWISHMVDVEFFGLDPGRHHLVSLFFHLLNVAGLFLLLHAMTGAVWRSAAAAALFAIHPLHVESVAWVSERKDVLSTFFWLLTLFAYQRYVRSPGKARYMATALCFIVGLLSKPMLVTLPFLLLLLDYWPLNRWHSLSPPGDRSPSPWNPTSRYRLLLEKLPLIALSLLASAMTFVAQQKGGAVVSLETLSLSHRLANSFISYVFYIRNMLLPSDLGAFYLLPSDRHPLWLSAGSGLLLLVISLSVLRLGRPYLPVGWFWYVGTLFPVIGLVQVGGQAMADRYTYVPLTGLFVALAWGVFDLFGRRRLSRAVLLLLCFAAFISLAALSRQQVGYWRDGITLIQHTWDVSPRGHEIYNKYGIRLAGEEGFEAAESYFLKALGMKPDYGDAHYNLGMLLAKNDRPEAAAEHFREVIRLDPDNDKAHLELGNTLYRLGEHEASADHFLRSLQINPSSEQAHHNVGVVLSAQGRLEESLTYYRKALQIKPAYAAAHYNAGVTLSRLGRVKEAIGHYEEALRIDPAFHRARRKLEEDRSKLEP